MWYYYHFRSSCIPHVIRVYRLWRVKKYRVKMTPSVVTTILQVSEKSGTNGNFHYFS
jgi:hypothetical protein